MVSYFEDIPREMEEAALIDRAGRLRAFLYVGAAQVSGGIAVTVIFVFLNAWNEFLFAVVLGATMSVRSRWRCSTSFRWSRRCGRSWALPPSSPWLRCWMLGLFAQRHIVKGLTVGAVKGGGRR